jgi:hypothetical protein
MQLLKSWQTWPEFRQGSAAGKGLAELGCATGRRVGSGLDNGPTDLRGSHRNDTRLSGEHSSCNIGRRAIPRSLSNLTARYFQ